MYHSISLRSPDLWKLALRPQRFAEHIRAIRDRFNPVSLTELATTLRSKSIPARSIIVTFDDGYRDNLHEAKPILERHNVPATIFVTTNYVDSERDFWWDEVEELHHAGNFAASKPRELRAKLQQLRHDERLAVLDALWEAHGTPPPAAKRTATADEIRELASGELIDIGAHTASHPRLSSLPRASQALEIAESRSHLSDLLGVEIQSFSFPHGDFDDLTVSLVREAGFSCACTSIAAPVSATTDAYLIPRIVVGDWSGRELAVRLDRLLL